MEYFLFYGIIPNINIHKYPLEQMGVMKSLPKTYSVASGGAITT